MKDSLIQRFFRYGLIQFGRFHESNVTRSFRFQAELIASYPDLLLDVASEALLHVPHAQFTRWLSVTDSVPLTTVLSTKTGIPMIYARGVEKNPAADLVGAYHVGHPTCLVLLHDNLKIDHWIQNAHVVGLQIIHILVITGGKPGASAHVNILFHQEELIESLMRQALIAPDLGRAALAQL